MIYRDFHDNGYKIFGLYSILPDGSCECLNPKCNAQGKHPRISNWQSTPHWEDEQLECMEEMGSFDTGYGVLCDGLLVVDVDEKNGGEQSYSKLISQIPEVLDCGLIVRTGSGGASKHLFFKLPSEHQKLQTTHKDFAGIDFKSSGFVVGAGSIHKSGKRYEVVFGSVDDITVAPTPLIELLMRKEKDNRSHFDITSSSDAEIQNMLDYIDPDSSYDVWIRVGMSIHCATDGSGFDLWNGWSAKGKKYDGTEILSNRWHSFGKSSNPATIGTLIHIAKENGYEEAVEFVSDVVFEEEEQEQDEIYNSFEKIDLNRPMGLVGRIVDYINSCSRSPRPNLAVAAALQAVSSAGGMRFRCAEDGTAANLFSFCVAGSGTGKESILQSYITLLRNAGIMGAVHGSIKSEQEIYRNIIRHQAAFYTVDEMGEMLGKIQGARKKSGTSAYLEGIIGALMSIYSKANGYVLVNGDTKEDIRKQLQMELKALEMAQKNNEAPDGTKDRISRLKTALNDLDNGIKNPFLNLFGFSAPDRFLDLMDADMASSGFFARALIFRDLDDNPRDNENMQLDTKDEAEFLGMKLSQLYHAGHSNQNNSRIELLGDTVAIRSTEKAKQMMKIVKEYFWEMGENQKEKEGMIAYTRRGYELVSRVSLILAMGEKERTDEHIKWAFALVKRDIENKIKLTNVNVAQNKGDAITSKILSLVSEDEGVTMRVLKNKLRPNKSETVEAAVTHLITVTRELIAKEHKIKGQITTKYYKTIDN